MVRKFSHLEIFFRSKYDDVCNLAPAKFLNVCGCKHLFPLLYASLCPPKTKVVLAMSAGAAASTTAKAPAATATASSLSASVATAQTQAEAEAEAEAAAAAGYVAACPLLVCNQPNNKLALTNRVYVAPKTPMSSMHSPISPVQHAAMRSFQLSGTANRLRLCLHRTV